MTGLWLYAYVVLPIMVMVGGYVALRLHERSFPPGHPGE
jgi:hypothetical protein